ncbi:hypothetical protein CTAYLR_006815 [Chrysophaeum taylorii]|uniref:eRF1/Pelota-like N-terminal domain-containing protein n=1 Tax=Chrysophaeum taylorii TaxID=2483200 RepID=A0AAD7UBF6_9STRA|nr:hypothetical protein CTAYLR_006815 [Chrysophaeum taylorii]
MKLVRTTLVRGDPASGVDGGSATVIVEESDDLWCAYNVIDVDDEVRASTARKVASTKGGEKGGSSEKRRVTLTLRATKVEYDGLIDCVRLSGTNVRENEMVKVGAFHTMELKIRSQIEISKSSWDVVHREALFEACDASRARKSGELGALAIDGVLGRARLYALSGSLARHVASVDVALPKKGVATSKVEKAEEKFFEKIRDALVERVDWKIARCVAVAGDDASRAFVAWLARDAAPALRNALADGKVVVVSTQFKAGVSTEALAPLLEDKAVATLIADTALAGHARSLEAFRAAEARDATRVVYGSVVAATEAADRRAIDTLLVLDERLKNPRDVGERRALAALVQTAKDSGADVLAFPARHVTADRLRKLGGIAAILRFPCPDLQEVVDPPRASGDDDRDRAPAPRHVEAKHKTSTSSSSSKKKKKQQQQQQPKKPALNYGAVGADYGDDDDEEDYYDY